MKKNIFFTGMMILLALSLAFLGCPTEPEEENIPLESLVGTVWAGETPRDDDWATFTFKADGNVVASFAVDNTTNGWTYTYNKDSKSGSFSGGGLTAFTISEDSKTLVITTYYAHGQREFKRLRSGDGVDPVPFTPGTLPADLVNTVWAGETPRSTETGDWATFTFKTGGDVVVSFAGDNSTNGWTYIYDNEDKSGTITGPNWFNGEFTINGEILTFPGYMGGSREFKRFR
jgi:hypothetical protein